MSEVTTADTGTPTPDAGNATPDGQAAPAAATTTPETPAAPEVKEPVVPESYEFQMPEGVKLDDEAAKEFTAIAKELKLDQPTAQKLADVGAKMAQRQAEQHAQLVDTWTEQTKADKEFGGDKFGENLAVAKTALDRFGTPELRDVLNMTGMGNHPEVIRAFYRVGKAISEDGFVKGAPAASSDPAKKLFPSMN